MKKIPHLPELAVVERKDMDGEFLNGFEKAYLSIMRETDRAIDGWHGADVIRGLNLMIDECNERRAQL